MFSKMRFFSILLLVPFLLALSAGDPAPNFSAKNQEGKLVQLSDFKNKFVLIYFYPKDDTPGCTKEACSFRDQYTEIKKMNAVVLGVSRQDAKSHQQFRSKHRLPFDLLVDSDGALAKSMGVDTMPIIGLTKRKSLLIGPDGKVIRFYQDVDPSTHTQEVLKDIKAHTLY